MWTGERIAKGTVSCVVRYAAVVIIGGDRGDEGGAGNRREYEISKTRWTLIEEHLLTADVRVIHCYSLQQLENALASYNHPTSETLAILSIGSG